MNFLTQSYSGELFKSQKSIITITFMIKMMMMMIEKWKLFGKQMGRDHRCRGLCILSSIIIIVVIIVIIIIVVLVLVIIVIITRPAMA